MNRTLFLLAGAAFIISPDLFSTAEAGLYYYKSENVFMVLSASSAGSIQGILAIKSTGERMMLFGSWHTDSTFDADGDYETQVIGNIGNGVATGTVRGEHFTITRNPSEGYLRHLSGQYVSVRWDNPIFIEPDGTVYLLVYNTRALGDLDYGIGSVDPEGNILVISEEGHTYYGKLNFETLDLKVWGEPDMGVNEDYLYDRGCPPLGFFNTVGVGSGMPKGHISNNLLFTTDLYFGELSATYFPWVAFKNGNANKWGYITGNRFSLWLWTYEENWAFTTEKVFPWIWVLNSGQWELMLNR